MKLRECLVVANEIAEVLPTVDTEHESEERMNECSDREDQEYVLECVRRNVFAAFKLSTLLPKVDACLSDVNVVASLAKVSHGRNYAVAARGGHAIKTSTGHLANEIEGWQEKVGRKCRKTLLSVKRSGANEAKGSLMRGAWDQIAETFEIGSSNHEFWGRLKSVNCYKSHDFWEQINSIMDPYHKNTCSVCTLLADAFDRSLSKQIGDDAVMEVFESIKGENTITDTAFSSSGVKQTDSGVAKLPGENSSRKDGKHTSLIESRLKLAELEVHNVLGAIECYESDLNEARENAGESVENVLVEMEKADEKHLKKFDSTAASLREIMKLASELGVDGEDLRPLAVVLSSNARDLDRAKILAPDCVVSLDRISEQMRSRLEDASTPSSLCVGHLSERSPETFESVRPSRDNRNEFPERYNAGVNTSEIGSVEARIKQLIAEFSVVADYLTLFYLRMSSANKAKGNTFRNPSDLRDDLPFYFDSNFACGMLFIQPSTKENERWLSEYNRIADQGNRLIQELPVAVKDKLLGKVVPHQPNCWHTALIGMCSKGIGGTTIARQLWPEAMGSLENILKSAASDAEDEFYRSHDWYIQIDDLARVSANCGVALLRLVEESDSCSAQETHEGDCPAGSLLRSTQNALLDGLSKSTAIQAESLARRFRSYEHLAEHSIWMCVSSRGSGFDRRKQSVPWARGEKVSPGSSQRTSTIAHADSSIVSVHSVLVGHRIVDGEKRYGVPKELDPVFDLAVQAGDLFQNADFPHLHVGSTDNINGLCRWVCVLHRLHSEGVLNGTKEAKFSVSTVRDWQQFELAFESVEAYRGLRLVWKVPDLVRLSIDALNMVASGVVDGLRLGFAPQKLAVDQANGTPGVAHLADDRSSSKRSANPQIEQPRPLNLIDDEDLPRWCEMADLHLQWLQAGRPKNTKRRTELDKWLESVHYPDGASAFANVRSNDRQNKKRYGYSAQDRRHETVRQLQEKWVKELKSEMNRRGL